MNIRLISFLKEITFFAVFLITFNGVSQKIDLLVIIDDSEPLKVDYVKKGDKVGLYFGAIGASVNSATMASRNATHSKKLQELVGEYTEREKFIKEMFETSFTKETDKINLSFLNIKQAEKYINKGKPIYKALKKDNRPYVLIVNERAGFTTPRNNIGKLSASSNLKVKVFDVMKKKRLFRQRFTAINGNAFELDSVLVDKNLFLSDYPETPNRVGAQIYFRLNGKDVLNKMATKYGLEAHFPPVKKTLKNYEKKFSFEVFTPQKWMNVNTRNYYSSLVAPKKNKTVVSILTDIDLLIKPLGQNDLDASEYVDIRVSRLQDMGIKLLPEKQELAELNLTEDWISYVIKNPNNGISIMFHKAEAKEYTINHEVILLGDNYSELLVKHKKEIEEYINNSRFKLN